MKLPLQLQRGLFRNRLRVLRNNFNFNFNFANQAARGRPFCFQASSSEISVSKLKENVILRTAVTVRGILRRLETAMPSPGPATLYTH
jgi:hypothetical protein